MDEGKTEPKKKTVKTILIEALECRKIENSEGLVVNQFCEELIQIIRSSQDDLNSRDAVQFLPKDTISLEEEQYCVRFKHPAWVKLFCLAKKTFVSLEHPFVKGLDLTLEGVNEEVFYKPNMHLN